jgi:glycosyltransferase involved in cell wall biosynthesis
VSNASADDIERHLHISRERIDVVPNGHGSSRRADPTPESQVRRRFGLGGGPIVFNLAVKKLHKNQLRLIQALPAVREAVADAQLVLAGAPTSHEAVLREEAARLGLADAVALPGYLSDADLEGLYAAASAFAFPSLNEGFGLPLLEAMAREVPVVTSSVSALPEVAGDAALLVDPTSVEEIAQAVTRVLTDDGVRRRLVSAGRERPQAFTWERCAQGTLDSWQRALSDRRRRRA